ncbi:MAG: TatD family nuclease-associated radical SAM protein [Candidatus Methanomethylophilaceae archaeon]|nr:TatD family nuclease-associated radical SAM protein [Candidatus Methanomethylophilaceae archaeon]
MSEKNFIYRYGSRYYLNLTNRCPCACTFCVRNQTDGLGDADILWLEKEPTAEEVMAELRKRDLSDVPEIVFCGYGEPTERFDTLMEIARMAKSEFGKPLRLDTNGMGRLITGRDIVKEMRGVIDSVSISLNAPDADEYLAVTKNEFGEKAYPELLSFIRDCRREISGVTVSVVGGSIPESSVERCAKMAEEMNVRFRVR